MAGSRLIRVLCVCLLVSGCLGARSRVDGEAFSRRLQAPVGSNGGDKVHGKCLCIFDFDETLRVWKGNNGDSPAEDSAGIIQKCKDFGYGIAIASANCNKYKMGKVLPQIDSDVFTPNFFSSQAFQHCESWKTKELTKILNHFGTTPECAMFFDDQPHNVHQHARNVGVNWRLVNGHYGVTWNDFWGLRPEMLRRCNCI